MKKNFATIFTLVLTLTLTSNFIFARSISSGAPNRIVCLAPNGAEILYALGCGSNIIARTDFCNYPEQLLMVPSVGGFDGKSFSIETILSYNPDFIYLVDGMHNHLENQLQAFGIRYYFSKATCIEDIFTEIETIGKIMNQEKQAKKVVNELKSELDRISAKNKKNDKKNLSSPKIYCEIFSSPYMSIGRSSFINDVIEHSGGKNIFCDIEQSYPQVSEEAIIVKNPDIIIVPYYSTLQIDAMYKRNGWESISAIKNRKIYPIDEDIISRPGPRIIEGIKLVQYIIGEIK